MGQLVRCSKYGPPDLGPCLVVCCWGWVESRGPHSEMVIIGISGFQIKGSHAGPMVLILELESVLK